MGVTGESFVEGMVTDFKIHRGPFRQRDGGDGAQTKERAHTIGGRGERAGCSLGPHTGGGKGRKRLN